MDLAAPDQWLVDTACGRQLVKWDPDHRRAQFGMAMAYNEDGSGLGDAVKIDARRQAEADALHDAFAPIWTNKPRLPIGSRFD